MPTTRRSTLGATAEAAGARYQRIKAMTEHKRRCRQISPPDAQTLNRMIAEFHAGGGAVTICPTVCVLPVQNGTGRAG